MTELEQQLFDAVSTGMQMRAAQATYFKTRPGPDKSDVLVKAKQLESKFDSQAAAAIKAAYAVDTESR